MYKLEIPQELITKFLSVSLFGREKLVSFTKDSINSLSVLTKDLTAKLVIYLDSDLSGGFTHLLRVPLWQAIPNSFYEENKVLIDTGIVGAGHTVLVIEDDEQRPLTFTIMAPLPPSASVDPELLDDFLDLPTNFLDDNYMVIHENNGGVITSICSLTLSIDYIKGFEIYVDC